MNISNLGRLLFIGLFLLTVNLGHARSLFPWILSVSGGEKWQVYDLDKDGKTDVKVLNEGDVTKVQWLDKDGKVQLLKWTKAENYQEKLYHVMVNGKWVARKKVEIKLGQKGKEIISETSLDPKIQSMNFEFFPGSNSRLTAGSLEGFQRQIDRSWRRNRRRQYRSTCKKNQLQAWARGVDDINASVSSLVSNSASFNIDSSCNAGANPSFQEEYLVPALEQGVSCLAGNANSRQFAAEIVGMLSNETLQIDCSILGRLGRGNSTMGRAESPCHDTIPGVSWPGVTVVPPNAGGTFVYSPSSYAGRAHRRELFRQNLFHEIFHNLGYVHGSGRLDLTYTCTAGCFSRNASLRQEALRSCRSDRSPSGLVGASGNVTAAGRLQARILSDTTGVAESMMTEAFHSLDSSFADSLVTNFNMNIQNPQTLAYAFLYSGNAVPSIATSLRTMLQRLGGHGVNFVDHLHAIRSELDRFKDSVSSGRGNDFGLPDTNMEARALNEQQRERLHEIAKRYHNSVQSLRSAVGASRCGSLERQQLTFLMNGMRNGQRALCNKLTRPMILSEGTSESYVGDDAAYIFDPRMDDGSRACNLPSVPSC